MKETLRIGFLLILFSFVSAWYITEFVMEARARERALTNEFIFSLYCGQRQLNCSIESVGPVDTFTVPRSWIDTSCCYFRLMVGWENKATHIRDKSVAKPIVRAWGSPVFNFSWDPPPKLMSVLSLQDRQK